MSRSKNRIMVRKELEKLTRDPRTTIIVPSVFEGKPYLTEEIDIKNRVNEVVERYRRTLGETIQQAREPNFSSWIFTVDLSTPIHVMAMERLIEEADLAGSKFATDMVVVPDIDDEGHSFQKLAFPYFDVNNPGDFFEPTVVVSYTAPVVGQVFVVESPFPSSNRLPAGANYSLYDAVALEQEGIKR
jgi:hypothetical protein